MSTVDRRLGSQLTFDAEKEKDIIKCIDTLSDSKKLGKFISHLLRLAFESPEVFSGGKEVISLVEKMGSLGVSPTRYAHFDRLSKEVREMQRKVDEIYEMSYKTYALSQMGKFIGSGDRADNSLRASFILERQISDMCNTLGIDSLNHTFVSNKLEDVHGRVDNVLVHILESYDSIMVELKDSLAIQVNEMTHNKQSPTVDDNSSMNRLVEGAKNTVSNTSEQNDTEDDDLVDLVERPVEHGDVIVSIPTGDRAEALSKMLSGG